MSVPNYFIPDRDPRAFYPLRDSQSVRAPSMSVAQKYIDALTAPGDLILDPFGAMPNVAHAAHALGRRAIVVESNPLWAWLARAMATLPPASEINAALAKLGDALKDDTPLRAHLQQLYLTRCAACAKPTPADYFVRTRAGGILARHYTCANCGATRDDDATEDDLKRAASFGAKGLHYHLAFERVAPEDKLHTERIHKMLDVYTPRNLYALVTLTQKIDSLFRVPRERNILRLLLLHLLDRGTSFYASPDAAAQLKSHPQFVEFNLWREIEIAARALAEQARPIPLADSSGAVIASDAPSVFVGRGNAITLARELPRQSAALVLTSPPTRRVAVWALAYLWGAWILGRAAVQSLVPFLDLKRDANWEWRWYSETLNESLKAIAGLLRPDAHIVFAFNESWHLVIETLLLAAAGAHLELESFLFQPRLGDLARGEHDDIRGDYRIAFAKRVRAAGGPPLAPKQLEERIRDLALASASDILTRRGEALAFSWVHHAVYARIAREGLLTQTLAANLKTPPGRFVHKAVVDGLSAGYAEDFDHYETPAQFVWLRRAQLEPPLIDRIDDAVREFLHQRNQVFPKNLVSEEREELQDAIYRQFSGDLTPEAGLIELCASANEGGDANAKPRALDALAKLGAKLGYTVIASREAPRQSPPSPSEIASSQRTLLAMTEWNLVWQSDGEIAHGFIWRDRAQFTDLVEIQIAPARGYIIVPENLVALTQAKMRCLPHLADAFYESGWDCVRVPFVEKLLNAEKIERSDIALMVGLIPPAAEERAQLELL